MTQGVSKKDYGLMRQLGKEELESKVSYFLEAYRFRTGHDLDIDRLKYYISEELHRLESKLISEAFSNLSHDSLRELLVIISKTYAKQDKHKKK